MIDVLAVVVENVLNVERTRADSVRRILID